MASVSVRNSRITINVKGGVESVEINGYIRNPGANFTVEEGRMDSEIRSIQVNGSPEVSGNYKLAERKELSQANLELIGPQKKDDRSEEMVLILRFQGGSDGDSGNARFVNERVYRPRRDYD